MRTGTTMLAILLLLPLVVSAQDSVDSLTGRAQVLYQAGRYTEALDVWTRVIGQHGRHAVVREGTAHHQASLCLRQLGEYDEAAALLEGYLKSHPKGEGIWGALSGIFHSHVAAGDEKKAQKAGKRLLKAFPIAQGSYGVLRVYIERGWKVPRMSTSYDVLRRWAFDRTNGAEDPDIRLGFLDLIGARHKNEKIVKGGGILYCRAWCHQKAGRFDEAIAIAKTHLMGYPRASERDKVRILVAESYLAMSPPKVEAAKKVLGDLLRADSKRYKERAERMLAAAKSGGASIQILEGYPRADGIGKVVLLTNIPSGGAHRKALAPWIEARDAQVVRFRRNDVRGAAKEIASIGPEFVAVAVAPDTIDINFQFSMLEMCRELDDDPMPDFHFGYLVARDSEDLGALLSRILAREKADARGTAASVLGVPSSPAAVAHLDMFLHSGHGTPRRIVGGLSASDLKAGTLPRGPVVVSGACFNGVCSRSYARSIFDIIYHPPETIPPREVLSLAWIHAGATGVIAPLEGDRGEMAGAEYENLIETAPALGGAIGYQYRLLFATLAETYGAFPRFLPGKPKRTGFFDVMLRGTASRILISDPSYRPLERPISGPTLRAEAIHEAGTVRVEVEVLKANVVLATNTLPNKAGIPFREKRIYVRVPLPEGFEGRLGRHEVSGAGSPRVNVRHEIWGGRRYVNVLAASTGSKLMTKGTKLTVTFPVID
jgi:tetratricopeptide (TPR) repeat protein